MALPYTPASRPPSRVPTGRGRETRFASGNQEALGIVGWAVGNPVFLDSEASKVSRYYRRIEEGSKTQVGHPISGLWGDTWDARWSKDLSLFGAGRGQKLVPFSGPWGVGNANEGKIRSGAIAAQRWYRKNIDATADLRQQGTRPKMRTIGTIKRPIPAGNYYSRAAASFNPAAQTKARIAKILPGAIFNAKNAALAYGGSPSKNPATTQVGFERRLVAGSKGSSPQFLSAFVSSKSSQQAGNSAGQAASQLRQANYDLAVAFQREVVALIERDHRRPLSGRLERAVADKRNRLPQTPGGNK